MTIPNSVSSKRKFLPRDFKITNWEGLQPYYEELNTRVIDSKEGL